MEIVIKLITGSFKQFILRVTLFLPLFKVIVMKILYSFKYSFILVLEVKRCIVSIVITNMSFMHPKLSVFYYQH